MIIKEKDQVFNLYDTNGRRSDVLNAYKIYLEILSELEEKWDRYPASNAQFLFYKEAVERSPEVFKSYGNYDKFLETIGDGYPLFLARDPRWINENFSRICESLDKDVEARSRHYTSNLVKVGFTDKDRNLTPVGEAYLHAHTARDEIEDVLPIDDINLIVFRQMTKLKIYRKAENGYRYYSPLFAAMLLLLNNDSVDRDTFEAIVQGVSPDMEEEFCRLYSSGDDLQDLKKYVLEFIEKDKVEDSAFSGKNKLNREVFFKYIKNGKSASLADPYYRFYSTAFDFAAAKTEENYRALLSAVLLRNEGKKSLEKAFGHGKPLFADLNAEYTIEEFLEHNQNNVFLKCENFNAAFYEEYLKSKRFDSIKEYSDTTMRLLCATGLIKYGDKVELSYKAVLEEIFEPPVLWGNLFGTVTEEEFLKQEEKYTLDISLSEIFGFSSVDWWSGRICYAMSLPTLSAVKVSLATARTKDFLAHIKSKYPKRKIIELLKLFSKRKNDRQIQKEVNDSASVPTIYEYVLAIAWYYLSGEDYDLLKSMNLTLNADFDPVVHAGGGKGDIVIEYDTEVVMLEVTLMKKYAQKRGEWEPVLRHSLNLKAQYAKKETITFFIADELDYNTVNIWRAVSAVTLESTDTHKKVEGVIIMPFENKSIVAFLENNIGKDEILRVTRSSFAKIPKITDLKWQEEILTNLGV